MALDWPPGYSRSQGEVIDTKYLDALSKIVEVLAQKWGTQLITATVQASHHGSFQP